MRTNKGCGDPPASPWSFYIFREPWVRSIEPSVLGFALYQGTTFSRAVNRENTSGFTACGKTHALYQGTTLVVPHRMANEGFSP